MQKLLAILILTSLLALHAEGADFGDTCEEDSDCEDIDDNVECYIVPSCRDVSGVEGVCTCKEDYWLDGDTCEERIKNGDDCDEDSECYSNDCDSSDGCTCDNYSSDYKEKDDNKGCERRKLGDSCSGNSDCDHLGEAECDGDCKCKDDTDEISGYCVPSTCDDDSDCYHGSCVDDECDCDDSDYPDWNDDLKACLPADAEVVGRGDECDATRSSYTSTDDKICKYGYACSTCAGAGNTKYCQAASQIPVSVVGMVVLLAAAIICTF